MSKAIYPGSFDPVTNGHLNIIERAAKTFDELIVCVMINAEKHPVFSSEERVELIRRVTKHIPNVTVTQSSGLLAEFAREQNCGVYKYAGVRMPNGMPALWSHQEQDEIASILSGRGHKHRVVDGEQPYALSGKMYCQECGRWFVGISGTGKSGKTYYYYRCPKCRRTFRRDLIEDAVSDTILESIHDPKVR